MADHNYTSVNPEENVCEELKESINEADCEEQVYMDPMKIVVEKPASNKNLKSEIIKEATQFVDEKDCYRLKKEDLGSCGVYGSIIYKELRKKTYQYQVKNGDNIDIETWRTVRFKYTREYENSSIAFDVHTNQESSSIVLFHEDGNEKIPIEEVKEKDKVFFLDSGDPDDRYIISIWSDNKMKVFLSVDEQKITTLKLNSEINIKNCYYKIFIINKDYETTVYDLSIETENEESSFTIYNYKDDVISYNKNKVLCITMGLIYPRGQYSLVIKSDRAQTISAMLKLHKDTLLCEYGGIWRNTYDKEFKVGTLLDIAAAPETRILLHRWYLPKEIAGLLKGMLEIKEANGELSGYAKLYDKWAPIISLAVSILGLFKPMAVPSIFLGAFISVVRPSEIYSKLIKEFVDKIQGGVEKSRDEKGNEIFREHCLYEEYYVYKQVLSDDKKLEYAPYLEISLDVWRDYPSMEGQAGSIGIFTPNNIKE